MPRAHTMMIAEPHGRLTQSAMGWLVSITLHGLVVTAAIMFMSDFAVPVPGVFHLEVTLVSPASEPSAPQPEVAPAPTAERVAAPPVPAAPAHPEPHVAGPTPVLQTSTAPVETPASEPADLTAERVQPPAPVNSSVPVQSSQEPSATAELAMSPPSAERPTPPASPAASIQAPSTPSPSAAAAPLPVRLDYGWLAEALWSRIQQAKRYPALARMNHWEGKVVVRAVIGDDGQLLDLNVARSSGHTVLDDEAIASVKQAFPLRLPRSLGKPQVALQIPISYQLDR